MGVIDLSPYKPAPATLGDANQIANGFQTLQNWANGNVDNNNFGAGKIFDPAKLMQNAAIDGDPLVWDNTLVKWVPASTLAAGRPRAPRVVVSAMSGGPPASPVDGDIWIATGIGPDSVRWEFQYDSAETTYKWKYLGGPAQYSGTSATAIPGTSTWTVLASMAVSRAGLYKVEASIQGVNNAGGTATDFIGVGVNGVLAQQVGGIVVTTASGNLSMIGFTDVTVTVAGQNINLMGWSNLAPNSLVEWFQVTPVKVI